MSFKITNTATGPPLRKTRNQRPPSSAPAREMPSASERQSPLAKEFHVCQVVLQFEALSETFLRAHRDWLPFPVSAVAIEAWDKPVLRSQEKWIFPRTGFGQMARKLNQHRLKGVFNHFFDRSFSWYIKDRKIDCVLAEYGPVGAAVSGTCEKENIPLVVHFHGFDAHHRAFVESMAEPYRHLFATASAVIAVSRTMRDKLISLGCPASKIHVIPCGVDSREFHLNDRPSPSGKPFRFFFVGRFVNKKGPIHLLLAFKECLERVDARLVMVGSGALFEATKEVATALGIADKVQFAGALSHAEVIEAMQESDCYVQHSIEALSGDSEGSPVSIIEAEASGLPVVATRHAGIVDSVIEGETGLLVDESDVEGMGERMAFLATHEEIARRFGRAGREHVKRNYDSNVVSAKLAEVLLSCRR